MADNKDGMRGRDLQDSQSGGESGRFGGNMNQGQRAGEAAGGPEPSDIGNAGGSSGGGGYGSSQDVVNRQDQQAKRGPVQSESQSRGERYDEIANGGRGPESVSPDDDEIARDQQAHQDRGQSDVEFEREQS
ncbi:MAG TPA: hypothetical protein VH331_05445 [Allosphingosinicella sp.]|jgi:hypothetical protein|nr:hypothetical protein [Allosphingosinicella sp.]